MSSVLEQYKHYKQNLMFLWNQNKGLTKSVNEYVMSKNCIDYEINDLKNYQK
jgi:hypothetical protein